MFHKPRSAELKLVSLLVAAVFVLVAAPQAFAISSYDSPLITQYGYQCEPAGMAFDPNGALWVTDMASNCYSLNNTPDTNVYSVVAEYTGLIGFSGYSYSSVHKDPASTGLLGFVGGFDPNTGFDIGTNCGPSSIAFDSSGNAWVADSCDGAIYEFAPPFNSYSPTFTISGLPSSGTCGPTSIAFDSFGNLWYADSCSSEIGSFSVSSGFSAPVDYNNIVAAGSGSLSCPTSIAFNSTGALWVADPCDNSVFVYNSGLFPQLAGGFGVGTSGLVGFGGAPGFDPLSLAINSTGGVWVADPAQGAVLEFSTPYSYNLNCCSVALGSSNGIYAPTALAFDPLGNLWVGDSAYGNIVEFSGALLSGGHAISSNLLSPTTFSSSSSGSVTSFSSTYQVQQAGSYVAVLVAGGYYGITSIVGNGIAGCTTAQESTGYDQYESTAILVCPSQAAGSYSVSANLYAPGGISIAAYVFPPGDYNYTATGSISTSTSGTLTLPLGTVSFSGQHSDLTMAGISINNGAFVAVAGADNGNMKSVTSSFQTYLQDTASSYTTIGRIGTPTPPTTAGGAFAVNVQAFTAGGAPITDASVEIAGQTGLTGLGDTVTFYVTSPGTYPVTVSAPGYATTTTSVDVSTYSTSVNVVLNAASSSSSSSSSSGSSSGSSTQTPFSSPGGSQTTSGGATGAAASFTNSGTSTETVNVLFVWHNLNNQVVNIAAQENVQFAPGQTLSFACTYGTPGTYSVSIFITDANGNGLSAAYTTLVTIS